MNVGQLQLWIDRLWIVSLQRWLFIAVSLGCVAGASVITTLAAGTQTGVVVAVMVALAVGAVIRPDSHAALAVEAAVVWQWLATTDDATTPWVIPLAAVLFIFHSLIALMAVTPINAHVRGRLLLWWLQRSGYVMVATVGVWAIVLVLDQRRAPGSVALTVAGFVTLTVIILVTRAFSATPAQERPG
ncbi:MAG TPA: hypothetical protein VES40_08510 [Ilumatobacteraceae bacterium]|nr:hypothetical protein [Ilumatobacteraceae bacterium]